MAGRAVSITAIAVALSVFAVWTVATWLLEGRIQTLLRPEAVADRAIYAIVANLLIGVTLALGVLRFLIGRGWLTRAASGFGRSTPSGARLIIGFGFGIALYLLQGAPSLDPVVLTNAFAQVLVVSAAEIVVCWAVVGATVKVFLKPRGRVVSVVGAGLAASALFGVYHFAHSPPFNTLGMVALLTAVGLATSAFFFITRDIYATLVFHNFLGMFGVVQALATSGELGAFTALQPPLLLLAGGVMAVLGLSDWLLLRRGASTATPESADLE